MKHLIYLIVLLTTLAACTRTEVRYQTVEVAKDWYPVFLGTLDNGYMVLLEETPCDEGASWWPCKIKIYEPDGALDESPVAELIGYGVIRGSLHYYDYYFESPDYRVMICAGQIEDNDYEELIFSMCLGPLAEGESALWSIGRDSTYQSVLKINFSFGDEPYLNPGNVEFYGCWLDVEALHYR